MKNKSLIRVSSIVMLVAAICIALPCGATAGQITQPYIRIEPYGATVKNDLVLKIITPSKDPDNNPITYKYAWRKNNVIQPDLTTNTVPQDKIKKLEAWSCVVTPNNGQSDGPSSTASITIANSLPKFIENQLFLVLLPGEVVIVNVGAVDADGDPLEYKDPVLPSWMKIDQASRILTISPQSESSSIETLVFSVRESGGKIYFNYTLKVQVIKKDGLVDLSAYLPPVGNQGSLASCVSWAIGYYYKSFQEARIRDWDVTLKDNQFNPMFIYNQVALGQYLGSTFLDNLELLKHRGCPTFKSMPSLAYGIYPSVGQYISAMPYRVNAYTLASQVLSITDLKDRLKIGDIFVIAIQVYSDLLAPPQGGDVYDGPLDSSAQPIFGHGLTVSGFDDDKEYTDIKGRKRKGAFKVVNSWGTNAGQNGFHWLSYDYVARSYAVITMESKVGYQPLAIASFHITHPRLQDLTSGTRIGTAEIDQKYPFAYSNPLYLFPCKIEKDVADIDVAIDITDYPDYLPPSSTNQWYIRAIDLRAGNSGFIDKFKISYKNGANGIAHEYYAGDLPVNIPDNSGSGATSYITGPQSSNHSPSKPAVKIEPPFPTTDDNLTASVSGSVDSDADPINFRYYWFKDNLLQNDLPDSTTIIPKEAIKKGEFWKCVVVPNDGKDDGPAGEAEVKIYSIPAPPVISNSPQYSSGSSLTVFWDPTPDPEAEIIAHLYTVATSPDGSGARVLNCRTLADGSTQCEWPPVKMPYTGVTMLFPNSLQDKTTYYFLVKAKNKSGLLSPAAVSPAIIIDATPPDAPVVSASYSGNTLNVHWTPSSDPETGISKYQYSVSTNKYGANLVARTDLPATATSVIKTGLNLQAGQTYYATVVACNGANLQSSASSKIDIR